VEEIKFKRYNQFGARRHFETFYPTHGAKWGTGKKKSLKIQYLRTEV
jgi:hypothetical protein